MENQTMRIPLANGGYLSGDKYQVWFIPYIAQYKSIDDFRLSDIPNYVVNFEGNEEEKMAHIQQIAFLMLAYSYAKFHGTEEISVHQDVVFDFFSLFDLYLKFERLKRKEFIQEYSEEDFPELLKAAHKFINTDKVYAPGTLVAGDFSYRIKNTPATRDLIHNVQLINEVIKNA